jgi:hypothetical protein
MITTNVGSIFKIGSAGYPCAIVSLNQLDADEGIVINFIAGVAPAATTTVKVVAIDYAFDAIGTTILAEIAGNTHYSLNSGAAATRNLGDLTFNFTVASGKLENRIFIKPGVASGGITFPTVMPRQLAFVFTNAALVLKEVYHSRRNHPVSP